MTYAIIATTTDLITLTANRNASFVFNQGTTIRPNNTATNNIVGSLSTTADSNGWFTYYCGGFRSNLDTTSGLASFKV
jgi:hypothetical protein